MSEPTPQSNNNSLPPSEKNPWRFWERSRQWQDQLYNRACHKALDIPDEMGDIHANRYIKNGVGTAGLIAAVAAGGLPALAVAWLMSREPVASTPPPVQPPPVVQPPADVPPGTDTFNKIRPLPGE